MKLTTFVLAAATLLTPGLAMAQTVECDGLAGGGSGDFSGGASCGPRDYMYRIEHLNPQVPETLKIGTDDGNPANYTNLCLPAGWSFTITSVSLKHYSGFTPHGVVSPGSIGGCPYTMLFIGPLAPGSPEYIGFDHPGYPHDVEWQMAGFPPGFANWSDPVGGGLGPVHSPLDCDTTCDGTVSGDTIVAGTKDNFVGSEPSSPGADLIPLLNCPLGMTNFFDSALTNQCFGHTFIGTWDTTCCVVGGELCLKIAATGSIPTTDALAFAENGVQIWVLSLNTLQWFATAGADSSWDLGDTLEMCLDLGNLPPSNLGVTNVLMTLQDGDFDVKIQDDTEVDYLELRVETCCDTACPPGPLFCDSITTDSCLVICPLSDIVFTVTVKDSCGNPVCDTAGIWLDFSQCDAIPCPGEEPFWPLVYPDSCDPVTGDHFFTVDAGLADPALLCDCEAGLYLNGLFCRTIPAYFLDIDGDLCVTGADWQPATPCNDYDCDGVITPADSAIHAAHLGHCCQDCPPGPPFCDSVTTDPCLVICPASDIVYSVWIKDSCGNPICDMTGTWLDFSNCEAQPCPGEEPFWPLVYPDSCHPATGQHFFTVDAGLLGCVDCYAGLYVNSQLCMVIPAKFLDTDGDLCVTGADWIPALPCNDYDCDGVILAVDQAIHVAHLDHCCPPPCPPGPPFCDSITTDSCLVICPLSDIVYTVTVKDSCGNPICDTAGLWLDFSQCNAQPCPGEEPNWPLVLPDSCDTTTGEHYFTVDAGLLVGADPCPDCDVMLVIGGIICKFIPARFLDITGDLCVTPADWLGTLPCNDYDCDGVITAVDQAIHTAHLDHCCPLPCLPGPPFCDSTTSDTCLLICPESDIVYVVTVKDSCGNPICDSAGTWLDFSQCSQAIPCPGEEPDWPRVFSDSCNPATGEHYFTVDAGLANCVDCQVELYVNSLFCRLIPSRFMDVNGDLCVDSTDWIPAIPCNDYNCNGVIDAGDSVIHASHLGHCCSPTGSIHGSKFHDLDCDGIHDAGELNLSGWTINLYQGANLLATTTTDLNGDYSFMNLCAGKYVITETVQSGWVQTSPPTVSHQVDLLCGQTIQGLEFGNTIDTCTAIWLVAGQVAGTKDNFVGPELSFPGASLIPLLNCPFGMNNFFDSTMSNRCFGHTFSGFWDTTCCIIGGTLCLRIAASGPYPSTDGIALAENGVYVWALTLNDLQSFATGGTDTVWSDGDTMEICLDLENLPPDNHGVTNVLAALKDGDFDIKFQDDTEIDWLELRVEICCTCCNHDGIRGDVDYNMAVNVADLTYLVNYLFFQGPAPPCLEEGDVDGSGAINVADLTYLVNFLFFNGPAPAPC